MGKVNRINKNNIPVLLLCLVCLVSILVFGITFTTVVLILQVMAVLMLLFFRQRRSAGKFYRLIYRLICLGMILWLVSFMIVQMMIGSQAGASAGDQPYDCILLLGAGLRGEIPSTILSLRLETSLDLADQHPDTPIIVSGGQGPGETVTEAKAMYDYLIEHGVDPNRILLEDRATSTYENFLFSKIIIDEKVGEEAEVLLVTNDFHMFRSIKLAERVGLEVDGTVARTPFTIRINYLVREYFAVVNSLVLSDEGLNL